MLTHLTQFEIDVISWLRSDSRISLASLAEKTGESLQSVMSCIESLMQRGVVKRLCSLVDFMALGHVQADYVVKADEHGQLRHMLEKSRHVNTLCRLQDRGFYVQCVFCSLSEWHAFIESLHGLTAFTEYHRTGHVMQEMMFSK